MMIFGMRKTLHSKAMLSKVKGRERNEVPLFPVKPGASVVTMAPAP